MDEAAADGSALKRGSIESRESWKAAWTTLAILSISFGSPLLIVVGMKPMQEALGTERSVLALAGALVWVGTGAGGVLMGWLADRIGVRATVAIAASMMAAGLALSSLGPIWTLYVGQGLMVGLLGNGGIYAPLLVYVSRWFDRRRGTAIALISSGQYIAGVVWPTLFERGIAELGWQPVMRTYAMVVLLAILPATLLLKPAPVAAPPPHARAAAKRGNRVAGLHPNLVQALICIAGFLCCVPMAIPSAHLVAFCSGIGINPTHSAIMLSVMLAAAFVARQAWGALADRIGGRRAVMAGSPLPAGALPSLPLAPDQGGPFPLPPPLRVRLHRNIPAHPVAIPHLFPPFPTPW